MLYSHAKPGRTTVARVGAVIGFGLTRNISGQLRDLVSVEGLFWGYRAGCGGGRFVALVQKRRMGMLDLPVVNTAR